MAGIIQFLVCDDILFVSTHPIHSAQMASPDPLQPLHRPYHEIRDSTGTLYMLYIQAFEFVWARRNLHFTCSEITSQSPAQLSGE